eukprot:7874060-Pyramimonas_sp.AAC.1
MTPPPALRNGGAKGVGRGKGRGREDWSSGTAPPWHYGAYMYTDKIAEGYSKFKCSSCGCAKNPKEARYCKHCGTPLAAVRPVEGGAPQSGAWSQAPPG